MTENPTAPTRRAKVITTPDNPKPRNLGGFLDRIRALLPENYSVGYNSTTEQIIITGHDVAGWTMDDYVLPRLASGLVFAEEIE